MPNHLDYNWRRFVFVGPRSFSLVLFTRAAVEVWGPKYEIGFQPCTKCIGCNHFGEEIMQTTDLWRT
jgi:hypothetical protein